jgi:hypothetical protein
MEEGLNRRESGDGRMNGCFFLGELLLPGDKRIGI